jgi:hypothetical protein
MAGQAVSDQRHGMGRSRPGKLMHKKMKRLSYCKDVLDMEQRRTCLRSEYAEAYIVRGVSRPAREFLNQLDSTPEAKTLGVLDRNEEAGR